MPLKATRSGKQRTSVVVNPDDIITARISSVYSLVDGWAISGTYRSLSSRLEHLMPYTKYTNHALLIDWKYPSHVQWDPIPAPNSVSQLDIQGLR